MSFVSCSHTQHNGLMYTRARQTGKAKIDPNIPASTSSRFLPVSTLARMNASRDRDVSRDKKDTNSGRESARQHSQAVKGDSPRWTFDEGISGDIPCG